MARVQIASQSGGWIVDTQGNALPGETVTCSGTVYAGSTGGTTLGSLVTDARGYVPGWVEVGTYTLTIGAQSHQLEATSGSTLQTVDASVSVIMEAPINVLNPPTGSTAMLGDGATSDSAALTSLLALADTQTGAELYFPPGHTYMVDNITIPNRQNLTLRGDVGSVLKKRANGPMFTTPSAGWGEHLSFIDLALDGNGASFSGDGIVVGGSSPWFKFRGGRIVSTAGYCLKFGTAGGGAQAMISDALLKVYLGQIGETNENVAAIYLPLDTGAPNRGFFNVQTDACLLVEDDGSQDTRFIGCVARNLKIDGDPGKLYLVGCRIASAGVDVNIRGTQCMIVGNAFAGDLVCGATLANSAISGNVGAGDLVLHASSTNNAIGGNRFNGITRDSGVNFYAPDVAAKDDGQAGMLAPSGQSVSTTTVALTANMVYVMRFVPDRYMTIASIAFAVSVASGTDDPYHVGILNFDRSAILAERTAGVGAVGHKLNATGVKVATLNASLDVTPGTVYYAFFAANSGATLNFGGYINLHGARMFGSSAPQEVCAAKATSYPLTVPLTGTSINPNGPLLALREA